MHGHMNVKSTILPVKYLGTEWLGTLNTYIFFICLHSHVSVSVQCSVDRRLNQVTQLFA